MIHKKITNERQVTFNYKLNQINSWCINYNQYISNKTKKQLRMTVINSACFKPEKKPLEVFKIMKTI